MSPREQSQVTLVGWLSVHKEVYNAPYGVLTGLDSLGVGKGKVRSVTFGMSRWLDCSVYIFAPNRITVRASGPQARDLDGVTFKSIDDLITVLKGKL